MNLMCVKRQFVTVALTAVVMFFANMLTAPEVQADVAVIVHPSNLNTLRDEEIARLFLGKKRHFPDGSKAVAIDQESGTFIQTLFASTLLNMNVSQLKAYWAQRLFSGRGKPPKAVAGDLQVKKMVGSDPAMIGYINASQVDETVRVVKVF